MPWFLLTMTTKALLWVQIQRKTQKTRDIIILTNSFWMGSLLPPIKSKQPVSPWLVNYMYWWITPSCCLRTEDAFSVALNLRKYSFNVKLNFIAFKERNRKWSAALELNARQTWMEHKMVISVCSSMKLQLTDWLGQYVWVWQVRPSEHKWGFKIA